MGCIKIVHAQTVISSPLLPFPAWRGCIAEPLTVWLAATEVVEKAIDLRIEGGERADAGEEAVIRRT
jgi:hypothetical protein